MSERQRVFIAISVVFGAVALTLGAVAIVTHQAAAGFGLKSAILVEELQRGLLWGGIAGLVAVGVGVVILLRSGRAMVKRLAEREAHYRAIVETAADGIITTDSQGIVHSFNRAAERIFGYEAQEVIGRNVSTLMPSPDGDEHDGYLGRYHRTGEKRFIAREMQARRKDGTLFPIHLAVSEAHADLFIGIIRDITARKEMERSREALINELERKNAELERFTYKLESPLTSISGLVESLEEHARATALDRLAQDVARIQTAVSRMQAMLDELQGSGDQD